MITCPTSKQTGAQSSSGTWWSVKVSDSGCTLSGEPTEVNWGNCEIRYYTYSGYYIVCPGEKVNIKTSKTECVTEIGPQEVKSVSFTAGGTETTRNITAKVAVTGVKFTQNAKCPGGAGTFTTGKIGGEILLKGFKGEKQQGIFIE